MKLKVTFAPIGSIHSGTATFITVNYCLLDTISAFNTLFRRLIYASTSTGKAKLAESTYSV